MKITKFLDRLADAVIKKRDNSPLTDEGAEFWCDLLAIRAQLVALKWNWDLKSVWFASLGQDLFQYYLFGR